MNSALFTKIGIAGTASVIVTEAVNLDPLWNALISLGISICSVLAVEGVMLLKKYLENKIKKFDKEDKKSDN